jgi:cyclophilin family peptidyl-prolyl cis-trans isomerase
MINPDNFYHIYKKYAILRPNNVSTTRFFFNYRHGRCSQQVIGINSFGSMPKTVALFLKLKDPEYYTGHTFRRTSATLLADLLTLTLKIPCAKKNESASKLLTPYQKKHQHHEKDHTNKLTQMTK